MLGSSDMLWMGAIIAGALYLLYRSVWKKNGHCQGCTSGTCAVSEKACNARGALARQEAQSERTSVVLRRQKP